MSDENSNPYLIGDLLPNDPFEPIFNKNRDIIFYEYMSYRDYLNFLRIIGGRLKDNYRKYGELQPQINQAMENPDGMSIMKEIQLDQESFIIFSKIFLDKLGILVEALVNDRPKNGRSYSFTDHKDYFIKIKYPKYKQLLIDMHWYDQFLKVMRDKIIEHSGALSTMFSITRNRVYYRRKRNTFGFLSEKDRAIVQDLIGKYGKNNEEIKNIPLNPAMMLDEFIELILEHNIELEKPKKSEKSDLAKLGDVVQHTGGTIDAVILAKHIRKFLDDVATLFNN